MDGLKPRLLVKGTELANQWRRGAYQPLERDEHIRIACDLIEARR